MTFFNRVFAGLSALALTGIVMVSGVSAVRAAEFVIPQENGNVTVSSSEQHKNLYVVGGNVLVNSNTTGDLIVAGGNVTIEGTVEGDIMVAGGTVYINGAVGGDVRAVGGTLTLNSSVGGDVVVAGGTLIANEKATVGGDLYAAGGEMTLLGAVAGQVRVRADRLTINAAMPGNVELKAMQSISFGGKTVFGNVAKYKAPAEAQVENGASLGGLQFERFSANETAHKDRAGMVAGIVTLGFVIKLLAVIVAALVLQKLFPGQSSSLVTSLAHKFWMSLGIGLIAMIATPLIAIALMLSMVGFYVALIVLVAWILLILLSCLLGAVFVGAWLVKLLGKKTEFTVDWQAVVIGVVVVEIVYLIPILGFLVMAILVLASMGTLVRSIYLSIQRAHGSNEVATQEIK